MSTASSQYQPLFPMMAQEIPEENAIRSQNEQTLSLAIGHRSQLVMSNLTRHSKVRVSLRSEHTERQPFLGIHYYASVLNTVNCSRPDRHICRIGITYLVRCLRILNRRVKYAQITRRISHTDGSNTRMFDQQQTATQFQWNIFNVYPQVMLMLGEKAVGHPESCETPPARCCQECVDKQEDTDVGSANDSGVDLNFMGAPGNEEQCVILGSDLPCSIHDNATSSHVEGVSLMRYRWSVDETIAMHLLEAMESRHADSIDQVAKKKRIGSKLRQRIVKLFREIRTRYLS